MPARTDLASPIRRPGFRAVKTQERLATVREAFFGSSVEPDVWPQHREAGWCQLPRVMPHVFRALDDRKVSGDMDLSRVLLGLWAENMGGGVVEVVDEESLAAIAGLRGARGVRSWRERVRKLKELGFIDVQRRGSKDIGVVLILRPYAPMRRLRRAGLIDDGWWHAYQQKLFEVGALEIAQSVEHEGHFYQLTLLSYSECAIVRDSRRQGLVSIRDGKIDIDLDDTATTPPETLATVARRAGFGSELDAGED